MPECKKCGAKINYVHTPTYNFFSINQKKKKLIPVDQEEITIYVTGTQSKVKGHKPHVCKVKK
jgi:hypothetical protein